MNHDEKNHFSEGIVGAVLSCCFFLLFLRRLKGHLRDGIICIASKKRIVHGCCLWFSLLQLVRWIIYTSRYTRPNDPEADWSYTLHLISLCVLFVAFSVFILLWGDTLRLELKHQRITRWVLFIFCLFFSILVLILTSELWSDGFDHKSDRVTYHVMIWAQAVVFIFLSMGFLGYGLIVYRTIKILDVDKAWSAILWRLNFVMLGTTVCCLSRVLCMIALYYEAYENTRAFPSDILIVWLLFSQWIPFFGILFVMQYVTKKPEFNPISETPLLDVSKGNRPQRSIRNSARIDMDEEDSEVSHAESRNDEPVDITLAAYQAQDAVDESPRNGHTDMTTGPPINVKYQRYYYHVPSPPSSKQSSSSNNNGTRSDFVPISDDRY